ncbi:MULTISPECIES: topoisomerase DNA-binding C4 zinc finger domain-containing protein [Aeromonas]|uniref:Topoisomerase DNA-binding C4 zinc finger domain-containing protein n=2 Tax=Aeromonas caviae TaxID=648 RepID=A0A3S5WYR2_AERCA|nr:topoisomerase DNA-binding C4 zinc finger domain-containing protein [Aeromonas caviae]AXB06505.1 topoisomerase DNA-binding C4 zinc finger domain-containing protein [Aeromonas caviae]AXB08789.1 topoisomerase DNA-binding C4 zinc finger domain-containing protein [Aeromonas caviae]
MNNTRFFVGSQELQIEKRIGKGGEGEVFAISNMPGFAVKAYFPDIVAEREKKILAMVNSRLADKSSMVAFPHQIVVDGRGTFAGFVMRLIEKHQEIHELQTPSSRQKYFPKADYAFIVRVALNIARVFAHIHDTGCVIGDINQRSILVSPTATVAFIDADSFQICDGPQRYLCVVGVPEYTPPELQGKSLKTIVRTTDHDAFGLAVCLFQLLCMDRHPFSGRFTGPGDMSLENAIADYRFAYSSRNTGMIPPPGTVRLEDFTPKIAQLFEMAFSPNHVGKRPSASVWVEALGELESALRVCSLNKLHRYSRNAKECPWCRMEHEYGRPLFLDTDLTKVNVPNGHLDQTTGFVLDIPAFLSMLNNVAVPSSISVSIPSFTTAPPPSKAAIDARSKKQYEPLTKVAGICILFATAYAFSSGMPGIVALIIAAFGCRLIFRSYSPEESLRIEHQKISRALSSRIENLQRSSPIDKALQIKSEALSAINEYKQLVSVFGNIRNEYDKLRRQKQLDSHLSQFPIRGASIPKITSSDIVQLASYGFTTALDAKRRDVQQVHGIGPVKSANIAVWIQCVEAKFQFQSVYRQEDQHQIQKVQNEVITKQQGIEERLKQLVARFRQEMQNFERWQSSRDHELTELARQLVQIEVDLSCLKVPVPSRPNVPPFPVPPVSAYQRSGQSLNLSVAFNTGTHVTLPPAQPHTVTCPKCASQMVRRTARKGSRKGQPFWGCSHYPRCKGTRPI